MDYRGDVRAMPDGEGILKCRIVASILLQPMLDVSKNARTIDASAKQRV